MQHIPQENLLAEKLAQHIVFFDGVCNLCHNAVNWLIDHDSYQTLHFAPLQGETFRLVALERALEQGLLGEGEVSTIVLFSEGRIFTHSEAVIRAGVLLGGVWRLGILSLVIPAFLRDAVYGVIARNRYRWFGKQDSCRVPTSEHSSRFLP